MVNGRRGEARRWEKCFIEIVKNVGSEQKRDDDRDIFFISLRWLWRGRAGGRVSLVAAGIYNQLHLPATWPAGTFLPRRPAGDESWSNHELELDSFKWFLYNALSS